MLFDTPIEKHDNLWIKRDDLFCIAGAYGGKARAVLSMIDGTTIGVTSVGGRRSSLLPIVARIAERQGISCRLHTASGESTPEIEIAELHGATIVRHKPGYGSVIAARARIEAEQSEFTYVPYYLECEQARNATRGQVKELPIGIKRIVVPVGSGMTLAGILYGLFDLHLQIPVVGISVGVNVRKRLNKYAPPFWRRMLSIIDVTGRWKYGTEVDSELDGIPLNGNYEAKCVDYLKPGDLFWIVGRKRG